MEEEKQIYFEDLSEKKKIDRLEKSLSMMLKVFDFQLEKLKKYKNSKKQKEIGFVYFYETVNNLYENIEFSLKLGKGKFKHFNVYPTRVVCENTFRIEYYINQNVENQNEISFWELSRLMKRFYDLDKDETWKNSYEGMIKDFGIKNKEYPDINDSKAYKDPFPNMENLIKTSKLTGSNNFYIHYRFLSESHHSKLLSIIISKDQNSQYRRNLFYLNLFTRWILILVNNYIKDETKKEINDAIKKSIEILNIKQEIKIVKAPLLS